MFALPFFITASIIGVGVTLIDIMFDFSENDSEADGGGDADGAGDVDAVDADAGDPDGLSDDSGDDPSLIGHDRRSGGAFIRLVSAARHLVYFFLGFGPVGIAATLSGLGGSALILWPLAAGIGADVIGISLRGLMKKELNSSFTRADLIMCNATVLVSIMPGELGKVRVKVGGAYSDRYAKFKDDSASAKPGDVLLVVDVDDEYLICEKEDA